MRNPCPSCGTHLSPDHTCRSCLFSNDPAFAAFGAAQQRLADPASTAEQRTGDGQIVAAYLRAMATAEAQARTHADACGQCGTARRLHPGRHEWQAPTRQQQADRARARQAARDDLLFMVIADLFAATQTASVGR